MSNIFFGTLSENHIRKNIDKWMSIAGDPDIFSERDDHIEKYQEKLLGKYDVVSIDEALKRYPDADVWVTYPNPGYIPNMLAEKLLPKKIRFLEADLEYRKGCRYLGGFILYRSESFSPCCVTGPMPIVNASGSVRERLTQWLNYTTKLIDAIQQGSPNKCQGCHLLKDGFWRKSVKLQMLSFAATNRNDVCNFNCVYCFAKKSLKNLKSATGGLSTYEMLQQLSEIPEFNSERLVIQLGNGELAVNKHCDDILDIFLKTTWKLDLTSNLSVYREKLAALLESGRVVSIVTSLDAGTRETFKKIKQRDRFDKVVENLKRYPLHKTTLHVKYLFLEDLNDNEIDVDGYYEIVKKLGGVIMFSSNLTTLYTDKMRALASRIIKKAKIDGIKINAGGNFLHPKDAKFINEIYTST